MDYNAISHYFVAQISPALAFEFLEVGSYILLTCSHPLFLSTSLFSGTARCSRSIITHFSKESWVLLLENGIQEPNVGMLVTIGVLLLLSLLSGQI